MENGYNDSIDTSSLLLARGIGNNGYGTFGGNGNIGSGILTAEAMANGTATKEAIDSQTRAHSAGLENLLDANQFATTNDNITGGFAKVADTAAQNVNRVADQQFRSELRASDQISAAEFRSLDRQRDIEKLLNENAKDAALCCCDAKLLAAQNACDVQKLISVEANLTRSLILEVEGRSNVRLLDTANAKITQLETINALSGRFSNGNGNS